MINIKSKTLRGKMIEIFLLLLCAIAGSAIMLLLIELAAAIFKLRE